MKKNITVKINIFSYYYSINLTAKLNKYCAGRTDNTDEVNHDFI